MNIQWTQDYIDLASLLGRLLYYLFYEVMISENKTNLANAHLTLDSGESV